MQYVLDAYARCLQLHLTVSLILDVRAELFPTAVVILVIYIIQTECCVLKLNCYPPFLAPVYVVPTVT
jgi:hypothetical protein